jgi:hypothetical protein
MLATVASMDPKEVKAVLDLLDVMELVHVTARPVFPVTKASVDSKETRV